MSCQCATPFENCVPVCLPMCHSGGVIYCTIPPNLWSLCCTEFERPPAPEIRCPLPKLKSRFRVALVRGDTGARLFQSSGDDDDGSSTKKQDIRSKSRNDKKDGKKNEENEKNKEDDKKKGGDKNQEDEKKKGDDKNKEDEKKKEEDKNKEDNKNKENDKKKGDGKKEEDDKKSKGKKPDLERVKFDAALKPREQVPDEYCICTDKAKEVCECEVYKPLNFMLEIEVTGEFKPAYVPKAKKKEP